MSYMLIYFDCCACDTVTCQYNTKEELSKALKELVSSDTTNAIEIYECKKLSWDIIIKNN